MKQVKKQLISKEIFRLGYKFHYWYDKGKLDAICIAKWIGEDLILQKTYKLDDITRIIFNDFKENNLLTENYKLSKEEK